MITSDVNKWLEKVKRGQYSYEDAMIEFSNIAKYLTRQEIEHIKRKLNEAFSDKTNIL